MYLDITRLLVEKYQSAKTVSAPRLQRYFAFFATQNCLAAQSGRISNIDAGLGILVLVQIPIVLYFFDKALSAHAVLPFVSVALMLGPIALALVALVFINATESPEASLFIAGMGSDVDATIDEALVAMTTDFEHNRVKIRSKARALRYALLFTVLLTVVASVVPLIHWPSERKTTRDRGHSGVPRMHHQHRGRAAP